MAARKPATPKIHPVILSGGAGTRLWPMSRALYPKQLLPLASGNSLLQDTVARVAAKNRFAPPLMICNEEHRFIVAEQLRQIGVEPGAIALEPEGRNTAPAVAAAACMLAAEDPEALMLVLPSDHVIGRKKDFRAAVEVAARAARAGALVTFGIAPTAPETGYGYIRRGKPLKGIDGCFHVAKFVEKPDAARARKYLKRGDHYWNSGMFLFAAARYLAELERLEPGMAKACARAVREGATDLDYFRLGAKAFAAAPSISIDYAVMERTPEAAVVPADMGWSDVGAWSALWQIGKQDKDGNVLMGDVLAEDVHGSYIRSEDRMVAAIGLEDVVVVATDDAVLVAQKDRAQDVKRLIERLQRDGRTEHLLHSKVYRPWGSYQTKDVGDRFQVKRIIVKPGGRLSLQKHAKRAEHWVVVRGTALVTRNDETFELKENESAYIPIGAVHRLENRGKEPVHLIEVQSGSYLGEDDIVRLDDVYGRAGTKS